MWTGLFGGVRSLEKSWYKVSLSLQKSSKEILPHYKYGGVSLRCLMRRTSLAESLICFLTQANVATSNVRLATGQTGSQENWNTLNVVRGKPGERHIHWLGLISFIETTVHLCRKSALMVWLRIELDVSSCRLLSFVLTLLVVAIQMYVIMVNQFCNISIEIVLSSAFEIQLFKLAQKCADDDNDDILKASQQVILLKKKVWMLSLDLLWASIFQRWWLMVGN